MRDFRLPDGTETNSADKYIDTWREFAKPIEVMTGLKHVSFDPGIQFASDTRIITLPTWFIERLNDYYKKVHDDYYEMMNKGS